MVTWHLPKPLYDLIETAKATGQEHGGVPKDVAVEQFAAFLLDRAARLFLRENEPKSAIIDPGTGEGYRGSRTPVR